MADSPKPICIIFGASGEIGGEIVNRLSANYRLFLTHSPFGKHLDRSKLGEWYEVDVTQSASIKKFIQAVKEKIEGPVHVVYCAGVLDDHPLINISDESWHQVIDTNLTGAFYVIRSIFQIAAYFGNGRILLIGSASSKKAAIGQAAYAASKAGLEALCRVCAIELGRFAVTCNVIAPGAVESSMFRATRSEVVDRIIKNTPLRKLGTAKDIAYFTEALLSPQAAHITGQVFYIDGGITAT